MKSEIDKICHGERATVIHFHGPYLGWQSDDDAESNKHFFADGMNAGCATGIDGIHCQTPYHPIRIPWADPFYDRLQKDIGSVTFKNVKAINCTKVGKGRIINWLCTVSFKDGKGTHTNIFNEVDFEHSKKSDMVAPFTMLEDNEKRARYSRHYNEIYDDKDDVYCSIVEARKDTNAKRLLTCFKTVAGD